MFIKYPTNIDLSFIYDENIKYKNIKVYVSVELDPPAINKYDVLIKEVLVHCEDGYLKIISHVDGTGEPNNEEYYNNHLKDYNTYFYKWKPQSHMRDYEIIHRGIDDVQTVYPGQGIGVIIIEEINTYVKLMYDQSGTDASGVTPSAYSPWDHTDEGRNILNFDLSLGYNVLFISNNKSYNLNEKLDHRDKHSHEIWKPKYSDPSIPTKDNPNYITTTKNKTKNTKKTKNKDITENKNNKCECISKSTNKPCKKLATRGTNRCHIHKNI